ncbi:hypothetical protein GCM10009830_08610 [Glycomyces endophyticus]|uniref:Integral membrane protein n=1 Tax=Glycomyces endophyticus TaxID=480996 RepID=A0ABP4S7D4_9ACTN
MHLVDTLPETDRPRKPGTVRIAVAAIVAAAVLNVIGGLACANLLYRVAETNADRQVIVMSTTTTAILWSAIALTTVATAARIAIIKGVNQGRPVARTAAFAVEALTVVVWAAMAMVRLADGGGVAIDVPEQVLRMLAVVCILGSAAVVVPLALPAARSWFRG